MCIVPLGDSLVQITRTEEKKDDRKVLLPVSFATLISPNKENAGRPPVELRMYFCIQMRRRHKHKILKIAQQLIIA